MLEGDTYLDGSFNSIAKKIKALDNEVKLKILHLLANEGEKSITDISKTLRINFSTAHKYLEQMENAGVLASHQVKDDRSKRLFRVRNYNLDLSPHHFAKRHKMNPKITFDFDVLDLKGDVDKFDFSRFSEPYLESGIPISMIKDGLESARPACYNGMSVVELKRKVYEYIQNQRNILESATEKLSGPNLFGTNTIAYHMRRRGDSAFIDAMAAGDLHIHNLCAPQLMSFSHDLHILSGLGYTHSPRNLSDFLEQLAAIASNKSFGKIHCFDSFNYFLAPFAKGLSDRELYKLLHQFFSKMSDLDCYVGLDIGEPRFMDYVNMPNLDVSSVKEKKQIYSGLYSGDSYLNYKNSAILVADIMLSLKEEFPNLKMTLKLWPKWDSFNIAPKSANNCSIANMIPSWQTDNAVYFNGVRFDANWKHWYRTVRVGEAQSVSVNVPKLALKSKSEAKFFENLSKMFEVCANILLTSSEIINRYSAMENLLVGGSKLKSVAQYIHLDDSLYTISLCGVETAIKLLCGEKDEKLMQKVVEIGNKTINDVFKHIPLRVSLKENASVDVRNRFYRLDCRLFDKDLPPYCVGLSFNNFLQSHANLPGGHKGIISKDELEISQLLKMDFGLVGVK